MITVTGRLNDGKPQQYRLLAKRPPNFVDIAPPSIAFLGHTSNGRPLILTAEGRFEILSKEIQTPALEFRTFVDETTWKRLDIKLLDATNADLVIIAKNDMAYWDKERNACVVALMPKRSRLLLDDGACGGAKSKKRDDPLNSTPAEFSLARVRTLFPNAADSAMEDMNKVSSHFEYGTFAIYIRRVKNTQVLVFDIRRRTWCPGDSEGD